MCYRTVRYARGGHFLTCDRFAWLSRQSLKKYHEVRAPAHSGLVRQDVAW